MRLRRPLTATAIVPFFLISFAASFTDADANKTRRCLVSCGPLPRPVCGSDNTTYPSKCQMRCHNASLKVLHRGRCNRLSKACLNDLAYARRHSKGNYIPTCRPDGTYAPVQCQRYSNICWCVNPQGNTMHDLQVTLNHRGRPRCGPIDETGGRVRFRSRSRASPRRRSSIRNRRPKKNCKRGDKALFNNNLLAIFSSEWMRETGRTSHMHESEKDVAVLNWKFRQLDRDNNHLLERPEYRELKSFIVKVLKPRRCAKTFLQSCDLNNDQQISQQEWSDCLTRDGMDDVRSEVGGDDDDDDNNNNEEGDEDGEFPEEDIMQGGKSSPPHGVLQMPRQAFGDGEEASGCLSDRAAALNDQKDQSMYVPECTRDGRYKKVQCYRSVGYCWCVNEDTGKNIPGTSVKSEEPRCEQQRSTYRPMVGCMEPKKTQFLRDLMEFFVKTMASSRNGTNITGTEGSMWNASKDEQAATWNFVMLDKNKNKMLERREWKAFRALVAEHRQLKRCGKKLPRHCDVNQDRRITMTEWLGCLNIEPALKPHVSNSSTSHPVRQGPNPLETLLRGD